MNITIPTKLSNLINTDSVRATVLLYLKLLNALNVNNKNALTEVEAMVLTEFILLPERYKYQRFSRYAKPKVLEALKLFHNKEMTPLNLNSYIQTLIKKGYVWRDEDSVKYIKSAILAGAKEFIKDKTILIKLESSDN